MLFQCGSFHCSSCVVKVAKQFPLAPSVLGPSRLTLSILYLHPNLSFLQNWNEIIYRNGLQILDLKGMVIYLESIKKIRLVMLGERLQFYCAAFVFLPIKNIISTLKVPPCLLHQALLTLRARLHLTCCSLESTYADGRGSPLPDKRQLGRQKTEARSTNYTTAHRGVDFSHPGVTQLSPEAPNQQHSLKHVVQVRRMDPNIVNRVPRVLQIQQGLKWLWPE